MADDGWRTIGGVATAWYDAPSLAAGAALVTRLAGEDVVLDLRATGARVRAGTPRATAAASAAARDLGLAADPSALQQVGVVVASPDPATTAPWWRRVLGEVPGLVEPPISFVPLPDPRPLRDRWHVDVVRPGDVVAEVAPGPAGGPYGVRHGDPDGIEVDLVPGDPLADGASDWVAVFSTTACYRVDPSVQPELVEAAAATADAAGFPLLVGVRPGLVVLETGKDQADPDAHGLELDVGSLAADLQSTARALGAVADPALPRFVQLGLDAADVAGVRAFWAAALDHVADRRTGLTDLVDPRRLDPVLILQDLDVDEVDRRRQRNRIHLELAVPTDAVAARVGAATDAGGRVVQESSGRTTVTDPEGNELVVVASPPVGI